MSHSSRDIADTTAPILVSWPESGHDVRENLVFTFNEPVKLGSGTISLNANLVGIVYAGDIVGNPRLTVSGNTIVFDPPDDLQAKVIYTLMFSPNAIVDLAGNPVSDRGVAAIFETGISPSPVNASGTAQDDRLHGSDFADTLSGGAGRDQLYGYGGDDTLHGGDEPASAYLNGDTIDGGAGDDIVYGNDGGDSLTGGEGDDRIYGGAHDDSMFGDAGNDMLDGGSGNDSLHDYEGDNILQGGEGNDYLSSGSLATGTLDGGDGNDLLSGFNGVDFIGGAGNDDLRVTLVGAAGSAASGGAGDDRIQLSWNRPAGARLDASGGSGIDTYVIESLKIESGDTGVVRITDFTAGAGGDRIDLSPQLPASYSGNPFAAGLFRIVQDGADAQLQVRAAGASGAYHNLLVLAGVQAGTLVRENFGGLDPAGSPVGLTFEETESDDTVIGTPADDTIYGHGSYDRLEGRGGNDTLDGGDGNDQLLGGIGNDVLLGGDGNDILLETGDPSGSNRLEGGLGNDVLRVSSSGVNVLDGGAGDDDLGAGNGTDSLLGGDGKDTLTVAGSGNTVARAVSLSGGAGDDQLRIGIGSELVTVTAQGGAGADTFAITDSRSRVRIDDFSVAQGDRLDLRALLPAHLSDNPFGPAGYLKFEQVGNDVLVYLDGDGAAGAAQGLARIATLAGVSLSQLTSASLSGGYDWRGS